MPKLPPIMRNAYAIRRGAKGEAAYITYGAWRGLYRHLAFMRGLRGLAERVAIGAGLRAKRSVFSTDETQGLQALETQYPQLEAVLLFRTGHYKATSFIGVVKTAHALHFVKYSPEAVDPSFVTQQQAQIEAYVGDAAQIAPLQHVDAHLLVHAVLKKRRTHVPFPQLEALCLRLCEQSYHAGDGGMAMAHGDFCHWNAALTSKAIVLFDYEEVGLASPYADFFHLHLKPLLVCGSVPRKKHTQRLMQQVAQHAKVSLNTAEAWLLRYVQAEQDKTAVILTQQANPALESAQKARQILLAQWQPDTVLAVHQGYELYGSDRMFLLSVQAMQTKWPQAEITVDLPQVGPLSVAMVQETGLQPCFGRGWILRRKNFRQGLRAGVSGLGNGLRRAWRDLGHYDRVYISTLTVLNYLLAGMFRRTPMVLHLHECVQGRAMRLCFSALIWLSGAKVIAVSQAAAQSLFLPKSRVSVVHNSVPFHMPPPAPIVAHHSLNMLILGRINPKKGQSVALEALAQLVPHHSNICLRIVGDVFEGQGHFKQDLEAYIAAHTLSNYVELLPFSDDPNSHYQWADVVLIPSTHAESFGLIAVEAMAHQRAVIYSDVGAASEVITQDKTGLLVLPNDAHALAQAIIRYYTDPQTRQAHAQAGYAQYLTQYKTEHFTTRFIRHL